MHLKTSQGRGCRRKDSDAFCGRVTMFFLQLRKAMRLHLQLRYWRVGSMKVWQHKHEDRLLTKRLQHCWDWGRVSLRLVMIF